MKKTVFGLFAYFEDANDAILGLGNAGYTKKDISVLASEEVIEEHASATSTGAGSGAIAGGLAGLLFGVSAFTIPGIGPIVGIGSLLVTLGTTAVGAGVGAVGGGLIGALVDLGTSREKAESYERALKEGNILVAVETTDENSADVERIFAANRAHDIHSQTIMEERREQARAH